MANYIVSYDLNGPTPSHKQVDEALAKLGAARGRILETVWWVGHSGPMKSLYDSVAALLSTNDSLIVVEAKEAQWQNLLISDDSLLGAWSQNR